MGAEIRTKWNQKRYGEAVERRKALVNERVWCEGEIAVLDREIEAFERAHAEEHGA